MKIPIKKILTESCVLFTVASMLLYTAGQFALLTETTLLTAGAALLLFLTCLLLGAAAELFHTKLPFPLAVLLFFASAMVILFVTLGYKIQKKAFALLFFTVIAFAVTVAVSVYMAIRRHIQKKKKEDSEAYTSMLK